MGKKKKLDQITWANFLDSVEEADAFDGVNNRLNLEKINLILWDYYEKERSNIIEFLLEQGYLLYNQTGIPPYFFQDCTNLTDIFIPKEIIYIGEGAFKGCSNLTIYCEASSQLDEDEEWDTGDRPVYWGINKNTFVDIIEIEGIEYIIKDEKAMVNKYVGNNTEVIIPSTIEVGKVYNVTSIKGYAFSEYHNLTSITLPNSLTSIGEGAFYNCSNLTNIVIPEGVTSIGEKAFFWCCDLKSITLPNTLISIGFSAFSYCGKLTSITLPSTLTSIENSAFTDCKGLTSIVIPEGVTSIGEYAFSDCTNLISVTLPSTLISIGRETFSNCSKLTNIVIPEGVKNIGYRAFHNCNNLTNIVIPNSVTSIDSCAFWWCDNLTVYCNCDENNIPTGWDSYWKDGTKKVYWKDQWKYINGVPTPIKK